VVRQYVEEYPDKVEILAGDIRDLEDWADPSRHELGCRVYALSPILNEDWDFPGSRGFQNLGELRDRLFQDLRWTNIDFRYHNHDGNVEGEGYAEMLSMSSC
jgi:hypothetical protein